MMFTGAHGRRRAANLQTNSHKSKPQRSSHQDVINIIKFDRLSSNQT